MIYSFIKFIVYQHHLTKNLNKNKVISLCDESGLDELETTIVLSLQKGKSRVSTCIEYGMSTQMYTNTLKRAISKLSDSI